MESKYFDGSNSKLSGFGSIDNFNFGNSITSLNPFLSCPLFLSHHNLSSPHRPPLHVSTRHLCSNLCFYKAYSPVRAWHVLRRSLGEFGFNPDELLEGWTAELVESQGGRRGGEVGAVDEGGGKWEIKFVAPNGEEFSSTNAVCRALGIDTVDSGGGKGFGSTPCVSTASNSSSSPRSNKRGPLKRSVPPVPAVLVNAASLQSPSFRDLDPTSLTNKRIKSLRSPITQPPSPHQNVSSPGLSLWPSKTFLHSKSRASPFGLLEELTFTDPWRLLLTCILLNRTTRVQVDKVLLNFLKKWPDHKAVCAETDVRLIESCVRDCGIWKTRALTIVNFSSDYTTLVTSGRNMEDLTEGEVKGLKGCGEYAWDAYRVFVKGEVNGKVGDRALGMYLGWKRGVKWEVKRKGGGEGEVQTFGEEGEGEEEVGEEDLGEEELGEEELGEEE
ncbi:hypothetical protein TrCOL_g10061 [Triparma columacea]|uniref:HhH-GPD domain-containing protein n=1 Tax=Triparma columacea TaxID=722753 RepID=A0A9W7G9D2_9STRA|nr:hypothetical protein TrCOL_g10061 [Triparma columacea]